MKMRVAIVLLMRKKIVSVIFQLHLENRAGTSVVGYAIVMGF